MLWSTLQTHLLKNPDYFHTHLKADPQGVGFFVVVFPHEHADALSHPSQSTFDLRCARCQ